MRQLFVILLFLSVNGFSQNLVPNNGFETYTSCPVTLEQLARANPWLSPTSGTSDFYHCNFSRPACFGNGVMGIFTWYDDPLSALPIPDYREYAQVILNAPLKAGTLYSVSFYVRPYYGRGQYAADKIGAYFSSAPVGSITTNKHLPFVPQVENASGNIITDDNSCTKISGTFCASGNERFMTIGNFRTAALTQAQKMNSTARFTGAYYLIDEVVVEPLDKWVDLGADQDICPGESITLDAKSSGTSFQWSTGETTKSVNITTGGTYSVTVETGLCIDTDSIEIKEQPDVDVELGNDTILCTGDNLTLEAKTKGTGVTYNWSTGETGKSVEVTSTGTYSVMVDNGYCTASDEVLVLFTELEIDLGQDTNFCYNSVITLDASPNSGILDIKYIWSTGETTADIQVDKEGQYVVSGTSGNCEDSDTIMVFQQQVLDLGNDTKICAEQYQLDAGVNADRYLWSTGDTTRTIVAIPGETYWLQITSGNCLSSDTVYHEKIDDVNRLVSIPNVFTPEGDGYNDFFTVGGDVDYINDFKLIIYNRWGRKLFEATDPDHKWDGKIKGDAVTEGVYFWLLRYNSVCSEKVEERTGTVTVIRNGPRWTK